jgi:hypothetical protein
MPDAHVPGDDNIIEEFEPRHGNDVLIMYYEGIPISVSFSGEEISFFSAGKPDWKSFEYGIDRAEGLTKRQTQLRIARIVKDFKAYVDSNTLEDEQKVNKAQEIAEMFRAYAIGGEQKNIQVVLPEEKPDEPVTRERAVILELIE